MRNRSVTLCLLLTAAMLMIGCSGTETQKVASYSKAVSQGLGEAYTIVCTVTDAFPVSKESQVEIDQIFTKANTTILQINAITRAIDASGVKTVGAADKQKILDMLSQISVSIDAQKIETIAGIKNVDSKAKFEATLTAVKTAISGAQVLLASTGGA